MASTRPYDRATTALTALWEQVKSTDDVGKVAELMVACDQLSNDLAVIRRDAHNKLLTMVQPGKPLHLEGTGTFRNLADQKRKDWDHPRVLADVIKKGVDLGLINRPAEVAPVIASCAGFSYWKSNKREGTGLIALGLERDDYCTVETVRKIQVTA